MLDFGEIQLDETHNPVESLSPSPRTSTPESTKSSRSLLSKVKKTFVTASTSTLRVRRKSAASSDPSNESNNGIVVTKNVRNRRLSQPEGKTAANPVPTSKVVKPSVAPPPPPTSVPAAGSSEENKDTAWSRSKRPPPPPARTTSKKENGHKECDFGVKPEALEAAEDNGVESSGNKRDLEDLDEFRIDLTTEVSQTLAAELLVDIQYPYFFPPRTCQRQALTSWTTGSGLIALGRPIQRVIVYLIQLPKRLLVCLYRPRKCIEKPIFQVN